MAHYALLPCHAFLCRDCSFQDWAHKSAFAQGPWRLHGLIRIFSPRVLHHLSLSAPQRLSQPTLLYKFPLSLPASVLRLAARCVAALRCQDYRRVSSFWQLRGSARLVCLPCAFVQSRLLSGQSPQVHSCLGPGPASGTDVCLVASFEEALES